MIRQPGTRVTGRTQAARRALGRRFGSSEGFGGASEASEARASRVRDTRAAAAALRTSLVDRGRTPWACACVLPLVPAYSLGVCLCAPLACVCVLPGLVPPPHEPAEGIVPPADYALRSSRPVASVCTSARERERARAKGGERKEGESDACVEEGVGLRGDTLLT